MRMKYGSARWRATTITVLVAVLAFVLMSTVPMAFAEEEGSAPEADVETPGASEGDDTGEAVVPASAFRLGDVRLSVVPHDAKESSLTLGVPVERTYLVTNEGELAYVRLASSLVYGDLVQPSETDVSDTPIGFSPAEEGETAPTCLWRLAKDGWWYRSEPLAAGESIVVHVPVEIPFEDAWVAAFKTGAPSGIEESLRVEAVQARNMSTDPAAAHPWGDLEIEIPRYDDSATENAGSDGTESNETSEEGGIA